MAEVVSSPSPTSSPLLEVANLRVRFPPGASACEFPVDDVGFELRPGEILGLVGQSGSGKTLTALSLLRLVPHPGEIHARRLRFRNQDLLSLPPKEMRAVRGRGIAVVFQETRPSLNPLLSVEEQMLEGMVHHLGLSVADARRRASELLEEVGLVPPPRILAHYPHQLSGGMCQRLLIAFALSCNPRILVADEPTSALDVLNQARILQLLKSTAKERGLGLLYVSHDLDSVLSLADRVGVMFAGRIVDLCPTGDLGEEVGHPYTRRLLESRESATHHPRSPLVSRLERIQPFAAKPGNRCPYAHWCDEAQEECLVVDPREVWVSHHRRVRCLRRGPASDLPGTTERERDP